MSNDCSQHTKEVAGISDMEVLAEMIENMSYEQHPKLFKELAKRYKERSRSDWKEGKVQLSIRGKAISNLLKYAYVPANEMRQISKPFMAKTTKKIL